MDENKWGLYGLIFGIVEFNLNLLVYIYLESVVLILWVVLVSLSLVVLIIVASKFSQINNNSRSIEKLIERLKRTDELIDLRVNIKELQRKVFK